MWAVGVHLDLAIAFFTCLPLLLWFLICREKFYRTKLHRVLFRLVFLGFWFVQIFLIFSEYYFFDEFKSRFNTVAVDYLLYPHEVFTNIWETYPVLIIVFTCLGGALGMVYLNEKIAREMWIIPVGRQMTFKMLGAAMLVTFVLGISISFKEHNVSNERIVSELANNGTVSFVSAAYTRNLDYQAFYRTLPREEAFQRTRRLLAQEGAEFSAHPDTTQRKISGSREKPKLNVVVFLEESLGSEFWGSLGRKEESLTPYLDRLATNQSILFENIYATGNRTVRGFEGVLASFPPLPGDSVVKRDRSEGLETIAQILKRDGYSTTFLYGGRGLFDSMRTFAVNNGYERFIEQKDFPNPTFTTAWGVCNEDLYNRTLVELRQSAKSGKPFFATILSVSNHKPYTYPAGRIAEDPNRKWRDYAVKYTDWAMGQFFEKVRTEPFYENTIFVVVADHGARVYGSESIPIHSYEIPFMILGPAVVKKPERISTLGCQLDVTPTILDLLGRPYESLLFGRSLFKPAAERHTLINHNREIGMFRDSHMVVLGLNKKVEYYHGDPKKGDLQRMEKPEPEDLELEKDATAMFEVADELYMQRRYRLPGVPPSN
ncbi:MAG: sulfatase [Verrucomicrobiales bacterium]|nr:sulfatase [Verrucomicrobiales bacterium]